MSDDLFNKIFEFLQMAKQMDCQAEKSKNIQDFYTKKVKQAIEQSNSGLAKQYEE